MMYVWAIGLTVLNLVWLALDLVGLPGNWLMVASAAALAWAYWDRHILGPWTLGAILVLALAGEGVEFAGGMIGARRGGAGRPGTWGALLGAFAGALAGTFVIPIPLVGSLLGACGGACLGAWGLELASGRKMGPAARAGVGSGIGRFAGALGKFLIGVAIWLIVAIASFWPG